MRGARFRNVSHCRRPRCTRQVRRNAERRTEPAVERRRQRRQAASTVTLRERKRKFATTTRTGKTRHRREHAASDGAPDGRADAWLEDSLLKSAHGERASLSFSLFLRVEERERDGRTVVYARVCAATVCERVYVFAKRVKGRERNGGDKEREKPACLSAWTCLPTLRQAPPRLREFAADVSRSRLRSGVMMSLNYRSTRYR